MSVVKKEFDIFDIYIEPQRKVITVRQRWKYNWVPSDIFEMWKYEEKKAFHDSVDRIIWQQWSGNYAAVSRVDKLENKKNNIQTRNNNFDYKRFIINFDIEWVTANAQWTANVEKVANGDLSHESKVVYSSQEVFLSTNDVKGSIIDFNIPFNTASHEFGHMIITDDEYEKTYMSEDAVEHYENNPSECADRLKHSKDYLSRMNIGNELRDRFIKEVDNCLDKMIPGVRFSAFLTPIYVKSINGRH